MPEPKRLGRPALDPARQPSTLVGVRLAPAAYTAVVKAAASRRESIQDLMRRALAHELKRPF